MNDLEKFKRKEALEIFKNRFEHSNLFFFGIKLATNVEN